MNRRLTALLIGNAAFATSPGPVANDGKTRNGAYTAALLQHIETPDYSTDPEQPQITPIPSSIRSSNPYG
jgi:hypothetical protein